VAHHDDLLNFCSILTAVAGVVRGDLDTLGEHEDASSFGNETIYTSGTVDPHNLEFGTKRAA
jgi:hypothetical protein